MGKKVTKYSESSNNKKMTQYFWSQGEVIIRFSETKHLQFCKIAQWTVTKYFFRNLTSYESKN